MIPRLVLRARALAAARRFFEARGVLEVQTGLLVARAITDPNVESIAVPAGAGAPRFLHTSPEYAMKRLLAEGSGDLFQICPVFRAGERSALHCPEFTMVEWYRLGFGLEALMRETAALVSLLLEPGCRVDAAPELLSYDEAFRRELGFGALETPQQVLADAARAAGLAPGTTEAATRDDLLDFLVAAVVGPRLGRSRLTCLHHYPASQAALARLDPGDPPTALRFELYCEGVELANGFVELGDAREQAARFAADNQLRASRGQPTHEPDERLLQALARGLPDCAGVALGLDRVLMLAAGARRLDEVLALPFDEA